MNKNQVLAATSSGNKDLIRKIAFEKRSVLSYKSIEKYSKLITNELMYNFNFTNKKTHLFYPIKENKEVDTWFLHKKIILKKNKFFCSIYNETDKSWDCVQFDPKVDFKETTFKVPVPVNYINSKYNEIEIIIIPLIAFDKKGNRIGYGKGIYDKILAKLNPNCIKIGVSFFEEEKDIINAENHDIKLDYCQTTNKLHKFI